MYTGKSIKSPSAWVPWLLAGVGIVGGGFVGLINGIEPLLLAILMVVILIVISFFAKFETVVIGLLILRAAIDCFSKVQLPTVFALGFNALTILYLVVQAFRKKPIQTDWFFWGLLTWWLTQGLWLILMQLGGLGFSAAMMGESLREWIRILSWVLTYLLVMQVRGKVSPRVFIYGLFGSLVAPITVALLQIVANPILPGDLNLNAGEVFKGPGGEEASRIRGTLGHPNGFVTYVFLFLSLTQWRLFQERNKLPWVVLLALLAFFYVSAKALYSIMMLCVFLFVLISPRLSFTKVLGGFLFLGLILVLFSSSEFGQARLASVAKTPLLNPDIDVSRAIILSQGDNNSFNWRISQWSYLMQQFDLFPWFGYGLGTSIRVSTNELLPHNDYVRALVEGGWVGFTTYLAFIMLHITRLVQLFRRSIPNSAHQAFCLTLLAVFLALPVGMLTENIWSHTMLFFYWHVLLAVAGWDWSTDFTRQDEQPDDPDDPGDSSKPRSKSPYRVIGQFSA